MIGGVRSRSLSAVVLLALLLVLYLSHHDTSRLERRSSPDIVSDWTTPEFSSNASEWHFLERRADTGLMSWDAAVNAGNCFMNNLALKNPPPKYVPAEGQGADQDKLENDWTSRPYGSNGEPTDTSKELASVLGELKMPTIIGDKGLRGFTWVQDKDFEQNGETKDGTGAQFINSMSAVGGYISAENNWGIKWACEQEKRGPNGQVDYRYPAVSRLVDVFYLDWIAAAGNDPKTMKKLKYFIRFHVENDSSKAIALQACDQVIPSWPGKEFDMTTDAGKAILGTPNGAGVAQLLIKYKGDLGVKAPTKVRVFKTVNENKDWYHFLFYISAVPKKNIVS